MSDYLDQEYFYVFAHSERRKHAEGVLTPIFPLLAITALLGNLTGCAFAHGVPEGDKGFIQESTGVLLMPFIYMGAKHMITGYDHLIFGYLHSRVGIHPF